MIGPPHPLKRLRHVVDDARGATSGANNMITVHHLETSRSQRVLWLLEELGVPYEIKLYKRDPKT